MFLQIIQTGTRTALKHLFELKAIKMNKFLNLIKNTRRNNGHQS